MPDYAVDDDYAVDEGTDTRGEERTCQSTIHRSDVGLAQVIVSDFGVFLGKKSERLVIRKTSKDGKKKVEEQIPFRDIGSIIIEGQGVSISTDVIQECVEHGIQIDFLSFSGKPYAKLTAPSLSATVITRREQLLAYYDKRGVKLAHAFVTGKLLNQAALLTYFSRYRESANREVFEQLQDTARVIQAMAKEVAGIDGERVDDIREQLLSLEGRAGALYWEAVGALIGDKISFEGREHRGAKDPFNSLLNYGYGILYSKVWGAIVLAGLEPFAGFVHTDRPGKPSLCLDMVEEFRQRIVDRSLIAMVNKGIDIKMEDGQLTAETRRKIADAVMQRLDSRELYGSAQHKLSTIIQFQARSVASFIRGEGNYRPFVRRW